MWMFVWCFGGVSLIVHLDGWVLDKYGSVLISDMEKCRKACGRFWGDRLSIDVAQLRQSI